MARVVNSAGCADASVNFSRAYGTSDGDLLKRGNGGWLRRSISCARLSCAEQKSLKKGLVEEGSEASAIGESRILASLAKPSAFIPTQLLTLQDSKVTELVLRHVASLTVHEHIVTRDPSILSIDLPNEGCGNRG